MHWIGTASRETRLGRLHLHPTSRWSPACYPLRSWLLRQPPPPTRAQLHRRPRPAKARGSAPKRAADGVHSATPAIQQNFSPACGWLAAGLLKPGLKPGWLPGFRLAGSRAFRLPASPGRQDRIRVGPMGSLIWTARWDPGRPVLIRLGRINLSPPDIIRNRLACGVDETDFCPFRNGEGAACPWPRTLGKGAGEHWPDLQGWLPTLGLRSDRRSEERRVGKECSVSCRSRWSPDH